MLKKDAYYFPHFVNARNDRKLRKARLQMGIEAYAIYFMTLEVLREQQDFKYPISDLDVLADDLGTSQQKLNVIINNYELFNIDKSNQFFSAAQVLAMQPWLKMKEDNRLKGIKSGQVRRKKIQDQIKQLENLSQNGSSEQQLNSRLSVDERERKEISNNKEKYTSHSKTIKKDFLNTFDSFVSYMRANFINTEITETTDRYTGELLCISVSEKGYLYDQYGGNGLDDFHGSRAKEIWATLYSLAQKGELLCLEEGYENAN